MTIESGTRGGPPRLTIAYPNLNAAIDGIRDHSLLLAAALRRRGAQVTVLPSVCGADTADPVLVQYQPFAYGRWGFVPWLPLALARVRWRRGERSRLFVIVHEAYMPMRGWRWTLLALWQRAQLQAIRTCADGLYGSTEQLKRHLERGPRRPVGHLPVGSNLPDASAKRGRERARLCLREHEIVVASFGTGHVERLTAHVAAAASAIAAFFPLTLLNLGAGAPEIQLPEPRARVIAPGPEPANRVAERLAAADLYLCAWRGGISTKRGSLMAALQHGLPVLATAGENTDAVLRIASGAMCLVSDARPDEFAAAAVALAQDAPRRAAMGAAARLLYKERFDWDVIARRLLRDLYSDDAGDP